MAQFTMQQVFALAVQHHQAGRLQEAERLYRQILADQPAHVDALHFLGVIAHQTGRNETAVDLIRLALLHRPRFPQARFNLGVALQANGQLDEAIAAYREAIALKPDYAQACSNLGDVLSDKKQLDEAIAAYRQAIAANPNLPVVHNNLGIALQADSLFDESRAAYRQAIVLYPNYAEAHNNLGDVLKDMGRLDEAILFYRRAVTLRSNYADAHSNFVYALHLHPAYDATAIADELRRWNHQHAESLPAFIQTPSTSSGRDHLNDRGSERRLRIGYVSPDFRVHVVGRNLLPLFQQHDRGQFEIICYAQVPFPDAMTGQLQQYADCWHNIVGLSDEQVANQIHEDRIDILVDLALHTAGNRLLVFASRPAPVQVTYLAYCGSSGLSTMDYRFSDPYLDPPDTDLSCYTEKTVRLARTYWCYQPGPAPAPTPAPVLKNGFVTFGCLNNFAKVSPAAIDLWARILIAAPDTQMIIHGVPGTHLNDVTQRMSRAGVSKDRVRFVGKQSWTGYVQTYSEIDIALDPFPYAGGITTCDALWMGVPTVTLSGETAVGRGGRSILSNLGLPELIAFTHDQYLQIAIDLAKDRDRIDGLRRGMRARMLASPLMDAEQFARDVEVAYRRMWHNWCERI